MIIIGEKINATRKSIAKALKEKDKQEINKQIQDQDTAGADYIDLNAGSGDGDETTEINDMKWLIDIALDCSEKKICIDSSNPVVIKKAAEYLDNRREWMINSIKLGENILKELLPVVKHYDVPVIALAMDENGIPETSDARLNVCSKIYEKVLKEKIKPKNIYFDPLILPLSANHQNAKIALDTLSLLKKNLADAKTTIGTSNVSFGLNKRAFVNQAFLISAISHQVDSAICDPTNESIYKAIILGKLISGKDKYCRGYSRTVRKGIF